MKQLQPIEDFSALTSSIKPKIIQLENLDSIVIIKVCFCFNLCVCSHTTECLMDKGYSFKDDSVYIQG